MTEISDEVRLFAEEPGWFLPEPSPPSRSIREERVTIALGAASWMTFASGVRVGADDVETLVTDVRAMVAEAGHERVIWAIGPSCTPPDLADRLQGLGFVPAEQAPMEASYTGMALVDPPLVGDTSDVEVRPIETLDDYRLADRILVGTSGASDEELAAFEATTLERYDAFVTRRVQLRFLGIVDGEPVAAGQLYPCEAGGLLGGSATLPEARGRGAYRALVLARWEEMVRRGAPALVIQAGAMSRPILERVGFQPVYEAPLLLDTETSSL